MKFLGMVLRNARRNPIRSALTIASLTVSLALAMMLVSFSTLQAEIGQSTRGFNRVVVMSSQGFTQPVQIARLAEVRAMSGVEAATPFCWYGGKFRERVMPFAQFGVDPDVFFQVYDEFTLPEGQVKDWQGDRSGCIIGKKLASDWGLKVGDPLALKDSPYPVNLDMTVRGIYDGPPNRDLRACYFHWSFLDEGLKKAGSAAQGNAGVIVVKVKDAKRVATLSREVDEATANSDYPTKTQSEEGFSQIFAEMLGDFQWIIVAIGLAVGLSLLCVSANAMAMALRERTTEVAVLKAIGFGKSLVTGLILGEALLVAGVGGLLGAVGVKLLCDVVDVSKYTAGMLPFFYVPWTTALGGLGVALGIGFFSGFIPATRAAGISVVDGLRKVI